jgi:hypothetical protein
MAAHGLFFSLCPHFSLFHFEVGNRDDPSSSSWVTMEALAGSAAGCLPIEDELPAGCIVA